MADEFEDRNVGLADPATKGKAITKHDTNILDPIPRSLYVGVSGSLVVDGEDDVEVTFANVPVGIFPFRAKRVKTGSGADSIVGIT